MRIRFFSPLLLALPFSPVFAQDTVRVSAGWNIIGSVKSGAVPDVLSTDPSGIIQTAFFGYEPGTGYQSTDTLGKGLGYWVKVSTDGIIVFDTETPGGDTCGAKQVVYDGYSYGTVKIGGQCWLDENLNVGVQVSGTNQTDNSIVEKYCYLNAGVYCDAYGGLYQWDEAMQYDTTEGTRGLCPAGWHIPTLAEWQTLSTTLSDSGNLMKAKGQGGGSGIGTNTSGFSALLGGYLLFTDFYDGLNEGAYFLSSTHFDDSFSYGVLIAGNSNTVTVGDLTNVQLGFSLRCIED